MAIATNEPKPELVSAGYLSPYQVQDLPESPSLKQSLGITVIVSAMAIGSGELILWPRLMSLYGGKIFWIALMGIFVQYWMLAEISRYTLATGESIFTGFSRMWPGPTFWATVWLAVVIITNILPAFVATAATALYAATKFGSWAFWAYGGYVLVLIALTGGKVVNKVVGTLSWIATLTIFFGLLIAAFFTVKASNVAELAVGAVSIGYVPPKMDWFLLLGALAYAGTGAPYFHSLWLKDAQLGMGKYVGRITGFTAQSEYIPQTGYIPRETPENISRWKKLMSNVYKEGVIVWGILCVGTIALFALLSLAVLRPQGLVPQGAQVAVVQAEFFRKMGGDVGVFVFLLAAFATLFSTQLGVTDGMARGVTDIYYSQFAKKDQKVDVSKIYYIFLAVFSVIAFLTMQWKSPLMLVIISAVLAAGALALLCPSLIYINLKFLPKSYRPGPVPLIFMGIATAFYWIFLIVTIYQYIK